MPGQPREKITMAERRYPVRIRIGVSVRRLRPAPYGDYRMARSELRRRWLGDNPVGVRGVLNDAVSIYFLDATLAGAFVARWCAGSRIETDGGVFRIRDDEPAPRIGAAT